MAPSAACGAYQSDNLPNTDLRTYTADGFTYNTSLPDDYQGSVSVSCKYNYTNYHSNGEVASERSTSVGIACNTAPLCEASDTEQEKTFVISDGEYGPNTECLGGCTLLRTQITGFSEDKNSAGETVAEYVTGMYKETGEQCTTSSNSGGSNTATPSNPTGENGEECTGDWYSNSSGGITCGSPDDGSSGGGDPKPPDTSCISDPSSCTDTDGDGTPDTPTACTVTGSNCTDTNGDGQPDTPSDNGTPSGETGGENPSAGGTDPQQCTSGENTDGSCNGDGDQDTVPDGDGSECRPETMTYDGKCPSGSNDDGCASKQYELVDGVSVCKASGDGQSGDGTGTGTTVTGGTSCDAEPTCTGDNYRCALLYQQWKTRCSNIFDGMTQEAFESEAVTEMDTAIGEQLEEFANTNTTIAGDYSEGLQMPSFFENSGGGCTWGVNIDILGENIADNGELCRAQELIRVGISLMLSGYVALTLFSIFTTTVPRA